MRNRFIGSTMAMAVVLTALVWTPAPAAAQSPPAKAAAIPRAADGKLDLSGFWDIPSVMDMSMGKEAEVPYTPLGRAAFKNHDAKDNPTGFCLPPGVPRIMQSPFPMAMVQTLHFHRIAPTTTTYSNMRRTARVFDAGTTATGLPYFVMELVDGVEAVSGVEAKIVLA